MNQLSLLFLLLLTSMVSARAALIPIDGIAAIVDDEVVTQRELKARIKLVTLNLEKSGRNIPSESVLQRQVLDVMINDSLLLQAAARRGIKITDTQVDQAMQNIARQNKMSLSEYRETLISNGLNYQKYRDTIHNEIAISALRQQYGRRQAIVTDADVDAFIKLHGADKENYEYRLAHILLTVADAAPPESVRQTDGKSPRNIIPAQSGSPVRGPRQYLFFGRIRIAGRRSWLAKKGGNSHYICACCARNEAGRICRSNS